MGSKDPDRCEAKFVLYFVDPVSVYDSASMTLKLKTNNIEAILKVNRFNNLSKMELSFCSGLSFNQC